MPGVFSSKNFMCLSGIVGKLKNKNKNLTMLCVRYGGLLDDGKKRKKGGLGVKGCVYFGNGPWVLSYT